MTLDRNIFNWVGSIVSIMARNLKLGSLRCFPPHLDVVQDYGKRVGACYGYAFPTTLCGGSRQLILLFLHTISPESHTPRNVPPLPEQPQCSPSLHNNISVLGRLGEEVMAGYQIADDSHHLNVTSRNNAHFPPSVRHHRRCPSASSNRGRTPSRSPPPDPTPHLASYSPPPPQFFTAFAASCTSTPTFTSCLPRHPHPPQPPGRRTQSHPPPPRRSPPPIESLLDVDRLVSKARVW